jgi:hypothetical protein
MTPSRTEAGADDVADRAFAPVAQWAAQVYETLGERVHVSGVGAVGAGIAGALVLPDHRRVELFFDESMDLSEAADVLADLVERHWVVWAVVPLTRLGEAHIAFSATAAEYVQGWWVSEKQRFAFTEPEIP